MKTRKNGFALLYAILLSGALLLVGVILMNIITKQLVYSSINKKSEASYYYAANSGRECLMYYAVNHPAFDAFFPGNPYFYEINGDGSYSFVSSNTFNCFGQPITMDQAPPDNGKYTFTTNSPVSLGDNKIQLKVVFNTHCLAGLDPSSCTGDLLEDKNNVVVWSLGSSNTTGLRSTRRLALLVEKPAF